MKRLAKNKTTKTVDAWAQRATAELEQILADMSALNAEGWGVSFTDLAEVHALVDTMTKLRSDTRSPMRCAECGRPRVQPHASTCVGERYHRVEEAG